MAKTAVKSFDIFCQVIDNYGDVGVCWRLARQLVELNFNVRLMINDLATFKVLAPQIQFVNEQTLNGLTVIHWNSELNINPAQVVIEGFACRVPAYYLAQMAKLKPAPIYINLEYLSAESWVKDCHLMPSIHPQTGLKQYFYFMSPLPQIGGLLREPYLPLKQKTHFIAQHYQVYNPTQYGLIISLFAYQNLAITALCQTLAQYTAKTLVIVFNTKSLQSLPSVVQQQLTKTNYAIYGNCTFIKSQYLNYAQYDALLQACHINIVRGEDSFVRAQWAQKPFIWHIYPQDEQAHMDKLNAMLQLINYQTEQKNCTQLEVLQNAQILFNNQQMPSKQWYFYLKSVQQGNKSYQNWFNFLYKQPDMLSQLLRFIANIEYNSAL